jgi:ATP-dependent RNA helicase DeaD
MESFEDLGLKPELIEALAAEGIEEPTAIQRDAIPVLRRGHSAALRAGPGAGVLVAYGAPLLDRLPEGEGRPSALVIVPTRETAGEVARALGRMGLSTGHRCAALGGDWALPGLADLLVSTPEDLRRAVRLGDVAVDGVQALVLDGAGALFEGSSEDRLEEILQLVDTDDLQGIVVSEPLTREVRRFIERRFSRSVYLPSEAAAGDVEASPVERGSLGVVTSEGRGDSGTLVTGVALALADDARHALIYFRSEDRAADGADLLLVHGYSSGAPGDAEVPVWIAVDPMDARQRIEAEEVDAGEIAVVSADVPADADVLDRRHSLSPERGFVLVHAREVPHLRRVAAEAGYRMNEVAPATSVARDAAQSFRSSIEEALQQEDLAAYVSLVEPLLDRWTGIEVAGALAAMLRRRVAAAGVPAVTAPVTRSVGESDAPRPPAWSRLFLTVGERDGVRAGDILGAVTGETQLPGDKVGRIDIRDTFTRVEIEDAYAEQVIRALNGITIRGRSVRADFDRNDARGGDKDRGGPPARGPARGRSGPPRR